MAKRLEIQVRVGVVALSPSAAAQQAGDLGRFSVYPPEEFLLHQETPVFALEPSDDWMRPSHITEDNLLCSKSPDLHVHHI